MLDIAKSPDATIGQAEFSRSRFGDVERNLEPYKSGLDIWVSRHFGNKRAQEYLTSVGTNLVNQMRSGGDGLSQIYLDAISLAREIAREKRLFHWDLEFPEAFVDLSGGRWKPKDEQGFDAVVGNPPYDVIRGSTWDRLSLASGCANLAGHFVVRGGALTSDNGGLGMIIPLSVTSGRDFEKVRQLVYQRFGEMRATHYSIRPAKIFPEADQRTSIVVCTCAGHSPCEVRSSRLYRFRDGQQEDVVLRPTVGDAGILNQGYIPRVGDEIGSTIYQKFLTIDTVIADQCADVTFLRGHRWYFHSIGRYWLKAYLEPPYFVRDGRYGVSSTIAEMRTLSPAAARSAVGVVNSSLFYFWWILQSDEFHLLRTQVEMFPFPPTLIADNELHRAVDNLMNDYDKKAVRKRMRVRGQVVEMDEIHARLSRDFIRQVDSSLAQHYGLTERELTYLDTYDEQFRNSAD